MLKVVTSQDVPGAPVTHFIRAPKTLYLHVWMADRASGQGKYVRDAGPTYFFRARMFGDPTIQSAFINSLEFGCETAWLAAAGAAKTQVKHPALGITDRLEYREGHVAVHLYLRTGRPVRLEVHRSRP